MSPLSICRCCLGTGIPLKELSIPLDRAETKEVYGDMLLESFNIELADQTCSDGGICDACICRLRDATSFKRQVLAAEAQFLERLIQIKEERLESLESEDASGGERLESSDVDDDVDDTLPLSTFTKESPKKAKRRASDDRHKRNRIKSDPGSLDNSSTSLKTDPGELNEADNPKWRTTGDLRRLEFAKWQEFRAIVGTEPADYFSYFVDDDLIVLACTETNMHAEKREGQLWNNLMLPEFKVFLGLLLHMGTIRLSKIQEYWNRDRLYNVTIFKEHMELERFLQIVRNLRFSPGCSEDPLEHVREIIYYFNEKMDRSYYPEKELLVQGIGLFKGTFSKSNLNLRQRKALKLYTLKERDGTVIRVCLDGKNAITNRASIERSFMNLLKGKFNNGHSVYADKYFNSSTMARRLLDMGTYCTGPIKRCRVKNLHEALSQNCNQSQVSLFCDGVHICEWKSKTPVTYITTEFKGTKSFINTKGLKSVKPDAAIQYENVLESATEDHTFAFYPCRNTNLRWHKKVFIHILQLLLINAHKFYNKYSASQEISFNEFRLSVIDSLLPEKKVFQNHIVSKQVAQQVGQPVAEVLIPYQRLAVPASHVISKIEERNSSGRIKRKMCRNCSKSGKRADSIYQCLYCFGQPGLCLACFDVFHAQLDK